MFNNMFGNLKILFVWMAPLILQNTSHHNFIGSDSSIDVMFHRAPLMVF